MHSPCGFIIIPRLSQAPWIWNANELVRIKKSLWSETSPNLLQDERYTAMARVPSLSLSECPRLSYICSSTLGHLHPPPTTHTPLPLFTKWKWYKHLMLSYVSWPQGLGMREKLSWAAGRRLPSLAINYSTVVLALRHGWSLCRRGFLSSQALCSLQRALHCLQDWTLAR